MEVTTHHTAFWALLILFELNYMQENIWMMGITLSLAILSLYKLYKNTDEQV